MYADTGNHMVRLEVCDDDNACITRDQAVTVLNATPSAVSAGGAQTFTEGDTVSLSGAGFTDVPANSYTATMDWDDS